MWLVLGIALFKGRSITDVVNKLDLAWSGVLRHGAGDPENGHALRRQPVHAVQTGGPPPRSANSEIDLHGRRHYCHMLGKIRPSVCRRKRPRSTCGSRTARRRSSCGDGFIVMRATGRSSRSATRRSSRHTETMPTSSARLSPTSLAPTDGWAATHRRPPTQAIMWLSPTHFRVFGDVGGIFSPTHFRVFGDVGGIFVLIAADRLRPWAFDGDAMRTVDRVRGRLVDWNPTRGNGFRLWPGLDNVFQRRSRHAHVLLDDGRWLVVQADVRRHGLRSLSIKRPQDHIADPLLDAPAVVDGEAAPACARLDDQSRGSDDGADADADHGGGPGLVVLEAV